VTTSLTPSIQGIRQTFSDRTALRMPVPGHRSAMVALIFNTAGSDLKVCIGRRASVPGDPWSGDLAFPGGKPEPGDGTLHDAAARETYEETGLVLSPENLIGDLGQVMARGPRTPLATYPLVYVMEDEPPPFTLNHELDDARWVSVASLWNPANWASFTYTPEREDFKAIRAMDHFLWGFSLRVLHDFSIRIGHPLTDLMEHTALPHMDGGPIISTRIA